jgi:hypothetical protein
MNLSYAEQIRQRIGEAEAGAMFISADFADIADTETIRRNLNRLVESGTIRRVLKGVYEKPKFSKLLQEPVAPNPDTVAKTLARNYRWTIAPDGNTALNLLGLSTQVPAVWTYISDGPYKTYEWNNTKLAFKRRTNKEISGLSPVTAMVVQALKTLGKDHVTPEIVIALSARLSAEERALLLIEAATSTDWVYDVIRQLDGGGENQ